MGTRPKRRSVRTSIIPLSSLRFSVLYCTCLSNGLVGFKKKILTRISVNETWATVKSSAGYHLWVSKSRAFCWEDNWKIHIMCTPCESASWIEKQQLHLGRADLDRYVFNFYHLVEHLGIKCAQLSLSLYVLMSGVAYGSPDQTLVCHYRFQRSDIWNNSRGRISMPALSSDYKWYGEAQCPCIATPNPGAIPGSMCGKDFRRYKLP